MKDFLLSAPIVFCLALVLAFTVERIGNVLDRRNHRDIEHPVGKERAGL